MYVDIISSQSVAKYYIIIYEYYMTKKRRIQMQNVSIIRLFELYKFA